MTEMQKQFEEWFKQAHTENVQKVDGEYVHGATERLWQAWQASRAEIVVKLPVKFPENDDKDSAEVVYILDILEQFSAGRGSL